MPRYGLRMQRLPSAVVSTSDLPVQCRGDRSKSGAFCAFAFAPPFFPEVPQRVSALLCSVLPPSATAQAGAGGSLGLAVATSFDLESQGQESQESQEAGAGAGASPTLSSALSEERGLLGDLRLFESLVKSPVWRLCPGQG